MRLHRLELEHWRGVAACEIDFDAGVTLVVGPNEVGKSSLVEALGLLFGDLDSSKRQGVKAIKPVDQDVGSRVLAELSAGELRLTFEKTFNRKPATTLNVVAPTPENATGREAHERALALLAEHADLDLWRALLVIQGEAVSQAAVGSHPSLINALDRAAGGGSGAQMAGPDDTLSDALMERVEAEFGRYYTPTGQPNADFKKRQSRVESARQAIDLAERDIAEVEAKAADVARLQSELTSIAQREPDQLARRHELEKQLVQLSGLRDELDVIVQRQEAAALDLDRLQQLSDKRVALQASIDASMATMSEQDQTQSDAQARSTQSQAAFEAAETAAAEAAERASASARARRRADALTSALRRRQQLEELQQQLEQVRSQQAALLEVDRELARLPITGAVLDGLQAQQTQVDTLRAQLEVASGELRITAHQRLTLEGDEGADALDAGATRTLPLTHRQRLTLEGIATLELRPEQSVAQLARRLTDAESELSGRLDELGMASFADVLAGREQRRDAQARRDALLARLDALLGQSPGQGTVDELAQRVETLAAALENVPTDVRDEMAQTDSLDAVEADLQALAAREEADAEAAEATSKQSVSARKALEAALQHASELKARRASADATLAEQRRQLATLQDEMADDTLAEHVARQRALIETQAERQRLLQASLDDGDLPAIEAQHETLKLAIARGQAEQREINNAYLSAQGGLDQIRLRGQYEKLAAAQAELEDAEFELTSTQQRASAAARLRTTLIEHRDAARAAYRAPMRQAIERLGRIVFGGDLTIELTDDLAIASRTQGGRTVPFDQLSVGAQEQLGIVTRLAVAQLVADDGGVPVILDDSLGFSDPERLARMCAAISFAAQSCQVIVLTCTPERFADLGQAKRVRLVRA